MNNPIPIATFFIGIHGFIALILSYVVVQERMSNRVWHGESREEVSVQPNYLENPSPWAVFVEKYTQKYVLTKADDNGVLQRKVRAYGNFTEYVPLALLFLLALELMRANSWLLWFVGSALAIARIAHAWGVITVYGPSTFRAIGFFLTWAVYLVGAGACVYYGFIGIA